MEKKYDLKPTVDFKNKQPVVLTLDLDPALARVTKTGKYTIFTSEGQVFWADEELLGLLKSFNKGSVVAITREYDFPTKTNHWEVNASTDTPQASFREEDKLTKMEERLTKLEERVGTLESGEKTEEKIPF